MVKIRVTYDGNLKCTATAEKGAIIQTDQEKLFSPTDLLGAALGTCILTIMGIVAHKLKADLSGMRATVEKEMANSPSRKLGKLVVHVFCPRILDPEVTGKLERAGIECPVHHSLHPDVQQEIVFHWGQA